MTPLNESEKFMANRCGERSFFLEWRDGKTTEMQELRGEVFTVQQPAKELPESGVCVSGWAPRARTKAEAGG